MATSSTKSATKKTFHFPKATDAVEALSEKKSKASGKQTPVPHVAKAAEPTPSAKKAKAAVAVTVSVSPEDKQKRAKKEKVIRDSFTMPESDYARLATLKQKCHSAGVPIKKSELLRAGLLMLEAASEKNFLAAVKAVETVKTGRPAKI